MIWQGAKTENGYAHIRIGGKDILAHRYVAFTVANRQPKSTLVAMHICDVPLCINPEHLVIGSRSANNYDAYNKGRKRGQDHTLAKLTSEDVVQMRHMYATGNYSQGQLAIRFGVGQSTASRIVRYEDWIRV